MPHARSPLHVASVALLLAGIACSDATTAPVPLDQRPLAAASHDGQLPMSAAMAELGDLIFDDPNLSIGKNQSCATCHMSAWGFTGPDGAVNAAGAVYQGSIPGRFGDRKPPSSAYSTLSPVFSFSKQARGLFVGGNFWDGRATGSHLGNAAADQAQGPFLNPMEQALPDAACVVYRVSRAPYIGQYRALWGDAILAIDFPVDTDDQCGSEGITIALSTQDRDRVHQEYDKIALAIAVYEASHNAFTSKFDASKRGMYKFTREEQQGMALFQGQAKCARCHTSGGQKPAFTDFTYDNLGVPANPQNPFYLTNPGFVDQGLGGFLAGRPEWSAFADGERGKMKVPTLRNVDLRPTTGSVKAYMHNGVFKSLEEVVHFYNTRDVLPECATGAPRAQWGVSCWPAPEVSANVNTSELGNLGLTSQQEAALVAFLRTLSDGFLPSSVR